MMNRHAACHYARSAFLFLTLAVLWSSSRADRAFAADATVAVPITTPLEVRIQSSAAPAVVTPAKTHLGAAARSVVYVIATGPDAPTASTIALEVAISLAPNVRDIVGGAAAMEAPMIVPQGTWTIDDLASQCKEQSATTRGAILIGPVESDSGSLNLFVFSNAYTKLSASVSLISCYDGGLTLAWTSDSFVHGTGNQGGIPFLPFAIAGGLLAAHTNDITQPYTSTMTTPSNTTTATTYTGGSTSSTPSMVLTTLTPGNTVTTATSQQSTSNAGSVLTGAATAVIGTMSTLASSSFPGSSGTTLLRRAAARLAYGVTDQIKSVCNGGLYVEATAACKTIFQLTAPAAIPPVLTPKPSFDSDPLLVTSCTAVGGHASLSFINTSADTATLVVVRIGHTDVAYMPAAPGIAPGAPIAWQPAAFPGPCSIRRVTFLNHKDWVTPDPAPPQAPTAP